MELSKSEKIIKEWNYGAVKAGREVTDLSLIVTNKRVIHYEESPLKSNYDAVSLKDINGVSATFKVASLFTSILMIVLGAIFGIVGFILLVADVSTAVGVIAVAVGAIWLGFGIYYIIKRPASFSASLSCASKAAPTPIFSCGAMKGAFKKKFKIRKIILNIDTAKEIASSVGALIMDIQNGVYDDVAAEVTAENADIVA